MTKSNWKRPRKVEVTNPLEKHFYIFCEGTKTEPNYFNGIKTKVESRAIYKNAVFVNVQGVGRGTIKIVEEAEIYVEKNDIKNSEICIVYDKDDFPPDDFNNVAIRVQDLNNNNRQITYHVAWSNQCIEYWFILHFDYYVSDNDRAYYIDYLNKKFKDLKIGSYQKNDSLIFEKLEQYGDADRAVRYAEKRLKEFENIPDSRSVPATKVHLLYKQLSKYFK